MTLVSTICVALAVFTLVVVWSMIEIYLELRKEQRLAPKTVYPRPQSRIAVKSLGSFVSAE